MYTWRSRPHSSWSSLSADSVQLARQRSVKATLVPSEYARERHELIEFLSLLGDPLLRLAPLVVQPAQVVLAPARLHAIERVSLQQRVEATGTLLERLTGKIDDAWARAVDRVVIGVLRPDLVLDPPSGSDPRTAHSTSGTGSSMDRVARSSPSNSPLCQPEPRLRPGAPGRQLAWCARPEGRPRHR
jgi:hypothetical protein